MTEAINSEKENAEFVASVATNPEFKGVRDLLARANAIEAAREQAEITELSGVMVQYAKDAGRA